MSAPNEDIKNFLKGVLPLYDTTFNDAVQITSCEAVPNSNDFVIKFPIPSNFSWVANGLRTPGCDLRQGYDVSLTNMLLKYSYNSYTIEAWYSGSFFLHIHKNTVDREICKGMVVYLKLPNVIEANYYKIYSVTRTTNSTTITILMQDGFFALKENPSSNLVEVYTDYGNTLSGYNGMKKIKSISESNGEISVTLERDAHFNFNINPLEFFCDLAKIHFYFRINNATPEEYRQHQMPEDGKRKRSALVVSITRSRPDDNLNLVEANYSQRILTLNVHAFFYRELYDDKSSGDRVEEAGIEDGMQDKALSTSDNIAKVLSIYKKIVSKAGLNADGDIQEVMPQQINLLSDGKNDSNMAEYRIVFDITKDYVSMNKSLLTQDSMIRTVQSQVNLQLYGN